MNYNNLIYKFVKIRLIYHETQHFALFLDFYKTLIIYFQKKDNYSNDKKRGN
jgi:hypothetical protein